MIYMIKNHKYLAVGVGLGQKGFTLIELITVIIIVGILASVSYPIYNRAVEKSRTTEALTTLRAILDAQIRQEHEISAYAGSIPELDVNIEDPSKFYNFELNSAAVPPRDDDQVVARAIRLPNDPYRIWITEKGRFITNNANDVVPGATYCVSE